MNMILPIYAYGHPVLTKKARSIDPDYEGLSELVANMWETMENAGGVGLAAPQIGRSIRLFLIDSRHMYPEGEQEQGIRRVFINPEKVEEGGNEWSFEEGCLSIPKIQGEVERPSQIRLRYQDKDFQEHEELFTGMNARVIQHEYDHLEGVLFTTYLKPVKRRLINRKLQKIKSGKIETDYKMKFTK